MRSLVAIAVVSALALTACAERRPVADQSLVQVAAPGGSTACQDIANNGLLVIAGGIAVMLASTSAGAADLTNVNAELQADRASSPPALSSVIGQLLVPLLAIQAHSQADLQAIPRASSDIHSWCASIGVNVPVLGS
jgi:selenophosphate synthetase-related protein